MVDHIESSLSGPNGEANVLRMGHWWACEFQGLPGAGGLLANTKTRADAMCIAADLVSGRRTPDNPNGVAPQGLLDRMREAADEMLGGKSDADIQEEIRRRLLDDEGEEWKQGR